MKYSLVSRGFFLSLLVFSMVSCCQPCEKDNLGDFALKDEVKDWLEFASSSETFKNNNNLVIGVDYFDLETGFTPQLDNCDEVDRCGLCCEEFNVEFQRVRAGDNDRRFQFEIVVIKDFFTHSPREGNDNISEYLEIRTSNQANFICRIDDLANAELTDVVTLNGDTFSNVLKCELGPNGVIVDQEQITAIYFNKELGIVGWQLGDSEVFSLIQ